MSEPTPLSDVPGFFPAVLDALPQWVFVLTGEATVLHMNAAAMKRFGFDASDPTQCRRRGGEAWRCLNAQEGGCGHGQACRFCTVQEALRQASAGQSVLRRKLTTQLARGAQEAEAHLLVTVVPLGPSGQPPRGPDGEDLFLMTMEDVTELIALRGLLSMCAECKKIRTEDNTWQTVEVYLKERLDVDFSHGLCPDCRDAYYEQMRRDGLTKG